MRIFAGERDLSTHVIMLIRKGGSDLLEAMSDHISEVPEMK